MAGKNYPMERPKASLFLIEGIGRLKMSTLKESLEKAPIIKFGEYEYFIHPMCDGIPLITKKLFEQTIDRIMEMSDFNCDKILVLEAMGMHLGAGLCMKTGLPFVVARKRSYGLPDEVEFHQQTGYQENEFYLNYIEKGERVTIVDDVLSTGGTLVGLLGALREMEVEVDDIIILFNKGQVKETIEKEFDVTIKVVFNVMIRDGQVKVLE